MKLIEQPNSTILAYRNEGELPFAEIYPPKLRSVKTWGIKYRDNKTENPFNDFNVGCQTREKVIQELEMAIKYGTDAQLGLDKV